MNTCSHCKYWRRGGSLTHKNGIFENLPDRQGEEIYPGAVLETDPESKTGLCLHPKVGSDCRNSWMEMKEYIFLDGIYSSCDEGRACLEVGEGFGCIHFCAKESK